MQQKNRVQVALLGRAGSVHYGTDTDRRVAAHAPTFGTEPWSIERPDADAVSISLGSPP